MSAIDRIRVLCVLCLLATLVAGCASVPSSAAGGKLRVVSTVAPLVNIIYNVGGDRIALQGLIPEGVDSHTFEPAPSDAQKLASADVLFLNGLHLEEPTRKLASANLKAGAQIVELGPQTIQPADYVYDFSFPKDAGDPNPHLWLNPIYALRYAEIVRDTLVQRDPANAGYYRANYDAFQVRLGALDTAIRTATATIPEQNRKLLTYHDSFAYFAPRYGLSVIGAIQPSDFAEPSPREVAGLIQQVRDAGVPAIFGSEVFPSEVLAQIGRETGARYVDTLRDDVLPGKPGTPEHSYLSMMVADVRTMTEALGGDAAALAGVDTGNVPGLDAGVDQPQQ
jgi:ABC-type Zn uptake system ZnuABC Zn-binding protein ZnuA